MPLTKKGTEIMRSMKKQYGEKEGERVFYASKNAGKISGVDARRFRRSVRDAIAGGMPVSDALVTGLRAADGRSARRRFADALLAADGKSASDAIRDALKRV